jgi:hypothetical protein
VFSLPLPRLALSAGAFGFAGNKASGCIRIRAGRALSALSALSLWCRLRFLALLGFCGSAVILRAGLLRALLTTVFLRVRAGLCLSRVLFFRALAGFW